MFKSTNYKNIFGIRIGVIGIVVAALCIGVMQFTSAPLSAQQIEKNDENHFCKEKDGKTNLDPENPCITEKIIDPTGDPAVEGDKNITNNPIVTDYINPGIRLLTIVMGIVVAIAIVISGVQYSAAGGDPSKVASAKKRLSGAILALLCYIFMFSFLQWLLPGGVI